MDIRCNGHGFQMNINSYCVSVQFGTMNYCNNRKLTGSLVETKANRPTGCDNAEVAVWKLQEGDMGDFVRLAEHDDVIGYVSSLMVAKLIGFLADSNRSPKEITEWALANLPG